MSILIICQKLAEDDDLLGTFVPWVRAIAKRVNHVDVLCLGKGEYDLPDNCKVFSLGKERGVSRVGRWLNFVKLMFKLMPKCDVTFSHMSPIFSVASWPFVKLFRKKAALWYAHGAVTWKIRLAEKCVDVIFTSTQEGCRIKSEKVQVVGQGVDVERFRPQGVGSDKSKVKSQKSKVGSKVKSIQDDIEKGVPSDQWPVTSDLLSLGPRQAGKFQMVSIGRIAPSKDYETMIKAVEVLINDGITDFEIKIIGRPGLKEDEGYFEKIKDMVKEKGLEEQIKFIGAVPNKEVVKYYQEADVYLNMSHTGSLDRAIVEAMACGCIVLTCNEAASTSLKNAGLENLMYEKGDYKQLARKILETKKLEAEKQGEIGLRLRQEVAKNHSVSALGEKITRIIQQI